MANQNIPGFTSMTILIAILALVGHFQVNAVDIFKDTYTESVMPKRIDISSRHNGLVRLRRDAHADGSGPSTSLNYTDVHLEGTEKHREAFMHWSGKKSNVIYILTCQRGSGGEVLNSLLWKSQDYGSSYQNVTGMFGKGALIAFFYVSQANNTRLIFTDTSNKKLYITMNELIDITTISVSFSPYRLVPHPQVADYVLAYSLEQRELFVSTDFGRTWKDLHEGVTSRIFWGDVMYDKSNVFVHFEVQNSNGQARYKKCNISADCRKVDYEASVGSFDPFSMLVIKEYIFVQKTSIFTSVMHVSHMRKDFKRAYFPPQTNTKDFLIVNADEGQVFAAVNHLSTSNVYLSDVTGQFYVNSLNDTAFRPGPHWLDVAIYEVKGINGTYIANQRQNNQIQTLITFDKGGNWQKLQIPDTLKSNCKNNCSLHLQIHSLYGPGPGVVSEANAPGLLLAHGNIGMHLGDNQTFVFVSRDGGWTWKETLLASGWYKFNILDHGSVMTAIEDAYFNNTNSIHYSLDEGKTWNQEVCTNKKIGVDGVLNEPGITTLIASVYGHETRGDIWAVVKLNFSSVIPKKCDKTKDYEQWKPSDQIAENKCILGHQKTYERRKQNSICYNGRDYERVVSDTSCKCDKEDFECDYGYQPASEHICKKSWWFDSNSILNECPEGKTFDQSQGYRKIASDKCYDGISSKDKYKPKKAKCPTVKPDELTISTSQPIAATNSDVVFTLTQGKGSKVSSSYTWSFNDSSPTVSQKGLKNSSVTHAFKKYGTYTVTVKAENKQGTSVQSMQIRVEDKITDTIVSVPWATKVNHVTDFDIDVYGPLVTHNQAHIHFLWTFGDEVGKTRPLLSWDRRVQHTYSKHGNYTVTVEAINSVSTIFKQYTVQVFDEGTIIRLTFSPNAEKFQFGQYIYRKMMFIQLLKQVLSINFGLRTDRLVVHLHSTSPVQADILLLKASQPRDASIDDIVAKMKKAVTEKRLVIPMDGQHDASHKIDITGATLVNDTSVPVPETHGPNLRAVYIAIPVLLCAGIVTVLVLVYYRRKFREVRRYSILRQRSDSDALLGGDDEDDPPLDLNPDFGTNERTDDDQLDLGTGSHLVMVTGRGEGGDNSVNC